MTKIKLFIVEDHRLLRETWMHFLSSKSNIEIVGNADNISEAFKAIELKKPTVLMLDINLKGESGISLINDLKNTMPFIKIIVVSMHDEYAFIKKMFSLGIQGYVSKNAEINNLFEAIEYVSTGKIYMSDDIKNIFVEHGLNYKPEVDLTFKEIEIIQFLSRGYSNKSIADELNIAIKTVEGRKSKIYKKLNVHSSVEVLGYAIKNGIILEINP